MDTSTEYEVKILRRSIENMMYLRKISYSVCIDMLLKAMRSRSMRVYKARRDIGLTDSNILAIIVKAGWFEPAYNLIDGMSYWVD